MNQPQPKKYRDYPSLVTGDVMEVLQAQATTFPDFLSGLTHLADYAYAPGKWTLKEMSGHIIDTERILVYRLTAIARGEQVSLPGFDEDEYVAGAHFADRQLSSFAEEFSSLRKANLYLFRSLTLDDLGRSGTASGKPITVERLLYTIAGHLIHHIEIINERYL